MPDEWLDAEKANAKMITTSNLRELLTTLGFEKNGSIYSKIYNRDSPQKMEVDFNNRKLIYPKQIKGRERNDGFNAPENFVVFECVCRLLEKGYRPEHIELEKVWTLGHEQKSGRADIIVYESDSQDVLLIIECKTAGKEFNNALKDTQTDGGQLFSYWQQERSTKWLALYTSDFLGGEPMYKCEIINCSDDANIVEMAKKDSNVKIFARAYTAVEKFDVWKETYNSKFYEGLIFGEDSVAYKIGVKPLRKKDLREFRSDDKIVNRFEEILRHNNVSDKENAFNRLIALFICKLVDEIEKQDSDEVEFQYKQGTDTYESLQDRLQRLHKQGMDEFMKEKIFYVEADYAEKLFVQYTGRMRQAAIEDLNHTIRILKFYSNNEFAFKDVHNEELFYQNGKILVEMVELFQNYRIVYPSKQQLLGDLFEQLLKKGFKQDEGQFFTPTPITRFIWDSLPLQNYIFEKGLPKVIDYACGAGHFLTEAIEAINNVRQDGENSWVEKHIFGIEKDYRLARVSKISMFMNGAGGAQIIFGDGLENNEEKGIENGNFDILVANPPYSVSAFKAHLKLKNNTFELLDRISNDGSEIETLFVERIAQLLKPKGIAAVVLPSSILSNNSGSYMGAREQLLKNFFIHGIVCFGSKTFGATGTNTVVLFLEKYNEPPKVSKLMEDVVNSVFGNDVSEDWTDGDLLEKYLRQINVSNSDYADFVDETKEISNWQNHDYFGMYVAEFESKKQTYPKKFTAEQIEAERKRRFYTYAKEIEQDKLYYFALTNGQTTLVITAPSDNAEQKSFLGYDWSNRKGAEGIVINNPGGKLYNNDDRFSRGTLACAIRNTFGNAQTQLPDDLQKFMAYYALPDMMDFSRAIFDKAIKTTANKKIEIKSKWEMVKLGEITDIIRGVTYEKEEQSITPTNNIVLTADNITLDGRLEINKEVYVVDSKNFEKEKQLKKDDCFMCFSSGSLIHVGKVCHIEADTKYYAGGFMGILRAKKDVRSKYLYSVLNMDEVRKLMQLEATGTNIKNLSNSISNIKIPLPPLDIQEKIVSECSKIDEEADAARKEIEEKKGEIESVMANVVGERMPLSLVSPYSTTRIPISNISLDSYISTDNLLQNCEGATIYDGTPNVESVVKYEQNDILVSNIRPYLKKIWFADKAGGCSPDVLVFHINDIEKYLPKFVYYSMRRDVFFDFMMSNIGGVKMPRGDKNNTIRFQIPIPPLTEQQRIVAQVEALEKQIAEAKQIIDSAAERKKAVLEREVG